MTDFKTWSIRKLKSFLKEIEHGGQGTQDLILKDQIIQLIESKRKDDERGKKPISMQYQLTNLFGKMRKAKKSKCG
jgi:hypothetical protein